LSKKTIFEIAKYHNRLGGCDKYMKEFARICLGTDPDLAARLEMALNGEIALQNKPVEKTYQDVEPHPDIFQQAQFQFLTAAEKIKRIDEYKTLTKELDRTRDLK